MHDGDTFQRHAICHLAGGVLEGFQLPAYPSGRADASLPLAVTATSGAVPSASQPQQQNQQAASTDGGAFSNFIAALLGHHIAPGCKLSADPWNRRKFWSPFVVAWLRGDV